MAVRFLKTSPKRSKEEKTKALNNESFAQKDQAAVELRKQGKTILRHAHQKNYVNAKLVLKLKMYESRV